MLMFCAQLKMNGDNAAAQCSTKSALLHFLCDAVVTTDSDCCLVNNSQSLAAFLSLGNQNVEGASLLDFMIPFGGTLKDGYSMLKHSQRPSVVLNDVESIVFEQDRKLHMFSFPSVFLT